MPLARWQATIVDEAGNIMPGATISVVHETVGNPPAALFSDRNGSSALGSTTLSDAEGYAFFHVAGGAYRITATLGDQSRDWRYVAIGNAAESDLPANGYLTEDKFHDNLPCFFAAEQGADPDADADTNTDAIDATVALAEAAGGGVVILPRGALNVHRLATIAANNVKLAGWGDFAGGTELLFDEATGDCVEFSQFGHMGIEDCYLQASVQRTAGYAIKIGGGAFKPFIRRVRIDCHYNGVYVANCSAAYLELTLRYLTGTVGVNFGAGASDVIYGARIYNIDADNPYPTSGDGTRRGNWAQSTAYNLHDIVFANDAIWQCTSPGTSLGSGTGPSGVPGTGGLTAFTTGVTDNTVTWNFVCHGGLAWIIQDSNAFSLVINQGALLNGSFGIWQRDTANTGTSKPMWLDAFGIQIDHTYNHGVKLEKGSGWYCVNAWIGSQFFGNAVCAESTWTGDLRVLNSRIVAAGLSGIKWNAGPVNMIVAGNTIAMNGQTSAGTYHGVEIAANATKFAILGNHIGTCAEGSGTQAYGVHIAAGASDDYSIQGNVMAGNATGKLSDGGSGTNKSIDLDLLSTISFVGRTLNVADEEDFQILNEADPTKVGRFSASLISAGETRTYYLPDTTDELVTLGFTQTLQNKTFDKLVFSQGTITNDIKGMSGSVTWNEGATQFFLGDFSVTDMASAATSRLLRYRVGGTEVFGLRKDGLIFNGDANHYWFLNGGNPVLNFDTNDYFLYSRGSNFFSYTIGGNEKARVDATATARDTALMVYDVDNNAVERVTVGAADSGGSGFKVLRIPN